MKKLYIILIHVSDYINAKEICESVENQTFDNIDEAIEKISQSLKSNDNNRISYSGIKIIYYKHGIKCYESISEFMGDYNEYLPYEDTFMTYVYTEK